jgi:hypothetical protein
MEINTLGEKIRMKYQFSARLGIFLVTSAIAACSMSTPQTEKPNPDRRQQTMGDHKTATMSSSQQHNEHQNHPANTTNTTQTKFTELKNVTPQTPVKLAIDVLDTTGKPIKSFQRFQEQLMHIIIVSEDLEKFQHLHPTYKENGQFEVETTFPKSGKYTIFSDYKPVGQSEQVAVMTQQVLGNPPPVSAPDFSLTKTFGDKKVTLYLSEPTLKANQEVTITFNLQQMDNQPITNLQQYLGEKGHLVIIKQASPLTKQDYIHAHAMKDTTSGTVKFMTKFPQAGKYKLWGQFKQNDQIITSDFWVNVL